MTSTPSRCRDASQHWRTYSGSPRTPRKSPFSLRTLPNLVASPASSSRPAIARPTRRLLVHGPYMSAVSRKVTPRSSARWTVSMASVSSAAPEASDMPMQPSPSAETVSPCPSVRIFMACPLLWWFVLRFLLHDGALTCARDLWTRPRIGAMWGSVSLPVRHLPPVVSQYDVGSEPIYPLGLSGRGLSLPWATLVHRDVLDAHRSSGCYVIVGGGAVTQGVRIRPSDREVKNDREPVVDGIGPCGDVNLVLAHLEELLAVEIP